MKKLIFFLLMFLSINSFAQNATITYFDKNGNKVDDEKIAATFKVVIHQNDTTYIVRNYQNFGPMIWQQTFRDLALSIPNGLFAWYNKEGNVDSIHSYSNGMQYGYWITFDTNGKIIKQQFYHDGIISEDDNYDFPPHNMEMVIQSSFLRGNDGWQKYISNNLHKKVASQIPEYRQLADNNVAIEVVAFEIKKDKSVANVYLKQSSGYPFDENALSIIISSSGQWRPTIKNGRAINSWQSQIISIEKRK